MPDRHHYLVGLAGQQNAGKTTTYNMLTGANQHVANYPGVTVEKKFGSYRENGKRYEMVDLPGTYSLSSFSLEERVTRDFLLNERPDLVVNVVDATALRRSLCFTFQMMEMGYPMALTLNMIDVARAQGIQIDIGELSRQLGMDVIATVSRRGKGKNALKAAIAKNTAALERYTLPKVDYHQLEDHIAALESLLDEDAILGLHYPLRWLAIKLLENDTWAMEIVRETHYAGEKIVAKALVRREEFEATCPVKTEDFIASCRDIRAGEIETACVTCTTREQESLSERLDHIILSRPLAPFFLVATVYLIYMLSIVQGYRLTPWLWIWLSKFKSLVVAVLPAKGMLKDPLVTSMGVWLVDSTNALLIYIPIFAILFALIAILEDSGYMARIAFILDRLLSSFGLHGQSTLPFILGGVFASGCAVPAIMATKGIPDERSRLATILTVPYMNCMSKVPLYTLLVSIYFQDHKSWAIFFISTVTIFMALIIARVLTITVLRHKERAPFIMEMPNYHLPTLSGILHRTTERVWHYIRKVGTVVLAVAICIFTLLHFPGVSGEKMAGYKKNMDNACVMFLGKAAGTPWEETIPDKKALLSLLNFYDAYKAARMNARRAKAFATPAADIDEQYHNKNRHYFTLIHPQPGTLTDPQNENARTAKQLRQELEKLVKIRKALRRQIRRENVRNSFFGMLGKALEPVTQYAGFDWKINIALISSFAARESSVATMGVLYQKGAGENRKLESRIRAEQTGDDAVNKRDDLHALALIIFFAIYPPCLASSIMVRVQTHSYRWMIFSILFSSVLGLVLSSAVFTTGRHLGLDGMTMMKGFYGVVLAIVLGISLVHKFRVERMCAKRPLLAPPSSAAGGKNSWHTQPRQSTANRRRGNTLMTDSYEDNGT